ncbi:MAG: GCN5-related N-acetyltransferase [Bryobacterales bacterium]|nr:GCN5-related N-acetyltransferase [Bryobacterales bacterium]
MAALVEPVQHPPAPELHDLRSLRAQDLNELLGEEESIWREALDWDFEKSAALVRKFVDLHALNGTALVSEGGVIGYCYYVVEDQKGLIGDLFMRRAFQTAALEQRLLNATLDELMGTGLVNRIESQLMLLRSGVDDSVSGARYFRSYPRDFLMLDVPPSLTLGVRRLSTRLTIERWTEPHQELAAQLIATTYRGHVDSEINDQYRSVSGARKFLYNIVQYPGCGTFFRPASVAAFVRQSGEMCGMCLASMVSEHSGHITQICVSPEWQGEGLGYELLRQSIELLRSAGCRKVSLTVTSENRAAMRLYRSVGFRPALHFAAYVWEGW